MEESDAMSRLRHDLANPLSAMLAEIQLLLLSSPPVSEEVRESLKTIEAQALRMRALIRQ